MFDEISKLAERTAAGLSRRGFLARLGSGALAFTAFVGATAAAGPPRQPRWRAPLGRLPGVVRNTSSPPWCVLNGGCCGLIPAGSSVASFKYLNTKSPNTCCVDSQCKQCTRGCWLSTCCGGTSNGCLNLPGGSIQCFADDFCDTPC
jgi:hypothetical protein